MSALVWFLLLIGTPECSFEDGSGAAGTPCVWVADERGNGRGHDVIVWDAP